MWVLQAINLIFQFWIAHNISLDASSTTTVTLKMPKRARSGKLALARTQSRSYLPFWLCGAATNNRCTSINYVQENETINALNMIYYFSFTFSHSVYSRTRARMQVNCNTSRQEQEATYIWNGIICRFAILNFWWRAAPNTFGGHSFRGIFALCQNHYVRIIVDYPKSC